MKSSSIRPWLVGALAYSVLLFAATRADAQVAPDVTFSISAVSQGPGKAVPTLTWASTTPAPASCAASGDAAWSGVKPASGTVALAVVSTNKNYVMACTWAADTQAVVSWDAVTTNSDDTPLTDLAGYNLYWNTGDASMVTAPTAKVRRVAPASTPMTTVTGLTAGPWFFAVTAVNAAGVESPISNVATKTIGAPVVVTKRAALLFPGTTVITVK